MDPALAATIGGGVGLVLGALAVAATRMSERARTEQPPPLADLAALPRGVVDVLGVLRSIAIVLDASDAVVNTSSSAVAYGLVRHGELVHQELRQLARQVRRDGVIREAELELSKGPTGAGSTVMRARVAPLGSAHILVLAYRDHLDDEAADAKTLVTLLLLREIAETQDLDLSIVSEMLDDRNRKLAEVTKTDDFIVSDNLMSLMMSQIAENPSLSELYNGLFAADGAEVYLRPAEWYVTLGTPVDFYSVAAGAAKRGETAIGYRDATPVGAGDGQASIRINPPKTESFTFGPGDRIIVFAED